MQFTPIIGLEVHIELKTLSKMFCGCPADHFGKPPNTQVCPVCLGLPGALPVPNRRAVEWTILAGLALNCQISKVSKFDRKNYFYPDLPKGYQISQYDLPLCFGGYLDLDSFWGSSRLSIGKNKRVRIRRVHLEEDTGKMQHVVINNEKCTLIDFNRSGVPLMEIVTEPDMNSSLEVKEFLQKLQMIVRYLEIADADMEKGQMRCEPTVNLKVDNGENILYTPLVEIKNVNSFRFVGRAIDYEIQRQKESFEETRITKAAGNKTTRGWSEEKQATVLQRGKEEAADYRYFPDPDIPPIEWAEGEIENFKRQIEKIELPDKKCRRFVEGYHLSEYNAAILVQNKNLADFFEKSLAGFSTGKSGQLREMANKAANMIINKKIDWRKIKPERLSEMLSLKAMKQMDEKETREIIDQVLAENQKAVEDFHKGKVNTLHYLVGQVMAKTKGQADPSEVRRILIKKITKE